jgi:hypothetical protein
MAVFDCMIFLLTLYRALSRHHSSGMTLLTVLLRDGMQVHLVFTPA